MLNLSDKELDRLSREAANQHDPGDLRGPGAWERLEMRLDKELGKAAPNPNPFRGIRRLPFQYAPVILLLVGVSYYFVKQYTRSRKAEASGSPPVSVIKSINTPTRPGQTITDSSLKALDNTENSTPASDSSNHIASTPGARDGVASNGRSTKDLAPGLAGASPDGGKTTGAHKIVTGNGNIATGSDDKAAGSRPLVSGSHNNGPDAHLTSPGSRNTTTGSNNTPGSDNKTSGDKTGSGDKTAGDKAGSADKAASGAGAINGIAGSHTGAGHAGAGQGRFGQSERRGHSGGPGRTGHPTTDKGSPTASALPSLSDGSTGSVDGTVDGPITAGRPGSGTLSSSEGSKLPGSKDVGSIKDAASTKGNASSRAPHDLTLSSVKGPHSLTTRPTISDSALRSFTKVSAPIGPGKGAGRSLHINRSLQFGFQVAPDFTSVNSLAGDKPGSSIGLTVDYQFIDRLYLQTGVLFSKKNYTARLQDCHVPYDYFRMNNLHQVDFVKGTLNMLEIPLNLRYDFSVTGSTIFFASGGLSSYVLLGQRSDYYYNFFGREAYKSFHYSDKQTYLFSAVNLSLGVETGLSNSLSLVIAPYVKLPTGSVGFGDFKMNSIGINFALKFAPVTSRKRK